MLEVNEILVVRGESPSRPSLENRVAYQFSGTTDLLGYRTARRRDQLVLGALERSLEHRPRPMAVLDIGCGYGNHLLMLDAMLANDPEVRLHGVDLDEEALAFGRAFAAEVPGFDNCSFTAGDLTTRLPFDDEAFDVVSMSDVIEHLLDVPAALKEVHRVLRPGGKFVMCTPLKDSLFKRVAATGNRLTRGKLYDAYYSGKDTGLDEHGEPVMEVSAGHDHVSEMDLDEIRTVLAAEGFRIGREQILSVMSGSGWFDRRPFLQAGLLALEAVHDKLQRPSWGHAVFVESTRSASSR